MPSVAACTEQFAWLFVMSGLLLSNLMIVLLFRHAGLNGDDGHAHGPCASFPRLFWQCLEHSQGGLEVRGCGRQELHGGLLLAGKRSSLHQAVGTKSLLSDK